MYQRKMEYARLDYSGKETYYVHERVFLPQTGWTEWLIIGTFKMEEVIALLNRSPINLK